MSRTILSFSLILVACAPGDVPPNTHLFSEAPLSEFNAGTYVDELTARPELDADKTAVLNQIVAAPEEFLSQRPPTAVLNEAELVFFAAGRTFELLDHYAAAVERGVENMRPRRAWLLERLGLHDEALAEARLAVANAPQAAEAHFVLGFVLGQSEEADRALLVEIRDAYRRAVALQPEFLGPSGVSAAEVLEQVRAIDSSLR